MPLEQFKKCEHYISTSSRCKQMLLLHNGYQCKNPDCTLGALAVFNNTGQMSAAQPDLDFSIPIAISDHTGTINSRLNDSLLEEITGYKVPVL